VTAALFLYIEAIMRQLPRTTLKQIALLSGQMGMQTSEYIHGILKEKGPELAEDFEVIDGVVLRKKTVPRFEATHFQETYPKVKTEKEQRFGTINGFSGVAK